MPFDLPENKNAANTEALAAFSRKTISLPAELEAGGDHVADEVLAAEVGVVVETRIPAVSELCGEADVGIDPLGIAVF